LPANASTTERPSALTAPTAQVLAPDSVLTTPRQGSAVSPLQNPTVGPEQAGANIITQPLPPPESRLATPDPRAMGNVRLEEARNLILQKMEMRANSSAVHVALLAAEGGTRVVARAGAMSEAERTRLRESIHVMLTEHGFSDVSIVIETPTQAGASSGQG
jgi:hypothetical protein